MVRLPHACTSGLLATLLAAASPVAAATPTVAEALGLSPIQKQVSYDVPAAADALKCTLKAQKLGAVTGYVVRDPNGQALRQFVDSNNDGVVDQWCYFEDGVEVYRDIDTDFDGRTDQYRWFNTGGSRWGLDPDEDGAIDSWQMISAEEVTAEAVAALGGKDAARFERLLLTAAEATALGLGEEKAKELTEKLAAAAAEFKATAAKQKMVGPKTVWIHFGGTRPGVYPAGTDGSTKDVVAYENVLAMTETDGQHGQVQIGTLIRAGDVWRLIAPPQVPDEADANLAASGFFFRPQASARPDAPGVNGAPTAAMQKLLAELEELDKSSAEATTPEAQTTYNSKRADVLEKLAAEAPEADDRAQWMRQLADTVSAAVQSGTYPGGAERLAQLRGKLSDNGDAAGLAPYYTFRLMTAEYGLSLQSEKADFVAIQTKWLKDLEQFIEDYPEADDTSEAMMQLAIAQEFAGQEDEAKKWYGAIVAKFPETAPARKAAGARTRLESVGNALRLSGAGASGGKVDIATLRGKVVLVHYWATWSEPCVADLSVLKQLQAKYSKQLALVGVSLDADQETLTKFLKAQRITWPQIFEPGGLESRPAVEMGILTMPTMMLVDGQGRVVSRNIHVGEIEAELKKLVR